MLEMAQMFRVGRLMRLVLVTVAFALLALPAGVAQAQNSDDAHAGFQRASRTDLAARIAQLEQQLASGSLKGKKASAAEEEIAGIRSRLENGDFQVGDRFVFTVRMDSVRVDTASVRDSLKVAVLALPDMSLKGVLRSELDERLNAHIARYIKNASARTNVLTRIAVLGAVRSPGYYYTSPDRPVGDIVMLAGGPTPTAKMNQVEAYRAGKRLFSSKEVQEVIRSGETLEQLDIRSGDEFRFPEKRRLDWWAITRMLLMVSSLLIGAINFLKWYYDQQE